MNGIIVAGILLSLSLSLCNHTTKSYFLRKMGKNNGEQGKKYGFTETSIHSFHAVGFGVI